MLLIFRYVSLSSITAAVLFPVTAIVYGRGTEIVIFSAIIAALIVYKHSTNIKRLLEGTESKFTFGKKQG